MIVAIGVDVLEIARIARLLRTMGPRFLDRVYTPLEQGYCASLQAPAPSLAARFCAKEAVMKCLRTGWTRGVRFRDIEVCRDAHGAVAVRLHGQAAGVAAARGIRRIHLSLSHHGTHALAFAVAED